MRIEDYSSVALLWNETPEIQRKETDSRDHIQVFLKRNPNLSQVAEAESEQIIGAILCGTDGRRGYLYHLAVRRDHRGKGIGTQLIKAGLNALKDVGATSIRSTILESNTRSITLHEKVGFTTRRDRVLIAMELGEK